MRRIKAMTETNTMSSPKNTAQAKMPTARRYGFCRKSSATLSLKGLAAFTAECEAGVGGIYMAAQAQAAVQTGSTRTTLCGQPVLTLSQLVHQRIEAHASTSLVRALPPHGEPRWPEKAFRRHRILFGKKKQPTCHFRNYPKAHQSPR